MIERVTISNFKSIGDVSVRLEPTTVLIGRSGVGKSNFLRGIRFLRNYLLRGEQAVAAEGGWHRIFPFGKPAPLSISVEFRLPGFDELFKYELAWAPLPSNGAVALVREQLQVGMISVIDRRVRDQQLLAHGQQLLSLGNMPTSTEAVLSFAAWTNGVGWHDFPAMVLVSGNGAPANATDATRGLDDAAGNFTSVLKDLTQDLRDQHARRQIVARLRQVNPSVASVELDSIVKPTNVLVTHRVGATNIPLSLSQESDGFRRYYAHLLALYQTPPRQVLMFEEPENGIAPGALRNLAEEFTIAPGAGRGQVLLSTQSPELLDGFDPSQIRVVDLDADSQLTCIGRLDPDQLGAIRDHLLHPGELLTVDLARRDAGVPIA